jgi:hypothetical protein
MLVEPAVKAFRKDKFPARKQLAEEERSWREVADAASSVRNLAGTEA